MFGIQYLKTDPTTYVFQFKNGNVKREGKGLSFFYFKPTSTIAQLPASSMDIPFVFKETTLDYQEVTVQGVFTYRIMAPRQLAELLDYSIEQTRNKVAYQSEDPDKLQMRLTNIARAATSTQIQNLELRDVLTRSDVISADVFAALRQSNQLTNLGVELINFTILAIKPAPETAKALEAEMREELLRQADQAIYSRRNASVEQERKIKENEMQTDLMLEDKQREIKERKIAADISVEEKRRELIEAQADNTRLEADAKGYATAASVKPLAALDPKVLQVLTAGAIDTRQLIGMAFKEIAENATNIGNLNITPDLLGALMDEKAAPLPVKRKN